MHLVNSVSMHLLELLLGTSVLFQTKAGLRSLQDRERLETVRLRALSVPHGMRI